MPHKNKIQHPQNILYTERLTLTPLSVRDVARYVNIAQNMRAAKQNDPAYFLYVRFDNTVQDLSRAAYDLLTSTEKSKFPEISGRYNICLKDGLIIGYIGFLYNIQAEYNSDLGVFLDPLYEHFGYAFEAQKTLLSYYFITYDDKIYLTVYPQNLPSYRLNTKCGAVKIAHTENSKYGSERDILTITRSKFIATVFNRSFKTAQEEKQFLSDYLKMNNKF